MITLTGPLTAAGSFNLRYDPSYLKTEGWGSNSVQVPYPGSIYLSLMTPDTECGDEGHTSYVPTMSISENDRERLTALHSALGVALAGSSPDKPSRLDYLKERVLLAVLDWGIAVDLYYQGKVAVPDTTAIKQALVNLIDVYPDTVLKLVQKDRNECL